MFVGPGLLLENQCTTLMSEIGHYTIPIFPFAFFHSFDEIILIKNEDVGVSIPMTGSVCLRCGPIKTSLWFLWDALCWTETLLTISLKSSSWHSIPVTCHPALSPALTRCCRYVCTTVTKPMKQPTQTHFTSSSEQAYDAQKGACLLFCLRAKHLSSAYL